MKAKRQQTILSLVAAGAARRPGGDPRAARALGWRRRSRRSPATWRSSGSRACTTTTASGTSCPGSGTAPVADCGCSSACSRSSRSRSRARDHGLVVRTPPGAAAALAEGIDRVGPAGRGRHDRRRQHDPHPRPGGRRSRGARAVAQPDHGGGSMKRAVLAYSGGLDTSVTIRWLVEQGYEVHAVAVDVGQQEDFDGVVERGRLAGAADVRVVDAVDRFAADYLIARDQGERPLRGQVPHGVGPRASADRRGGRARSRARSAPTWSRTAAPARATTRSGSRCRSACSRPTWRCSRRSATRTSRARRRSCSRRSGASRSASIVSSYSDRREPVGPDGRVRAARGPVGGAARGRVRADGLARRTARRSPPRSSIAFERGLPVALDGEASDLPVGDPFARRARRVATGSAGST